MEQKQSIESVVALHEQICADARALIEVKGHDYGRHDQAAGDTLGNLRMARRLGIVDSDAKSVLVRLCDKFARLASLVDVGPKTTDESIRDTVLDLINYAVYFYIFRCVEQPKTHQFAKTDKNAKVATAARAPFPDGETWDDELMEDMPGETL